jgi:hypothetical protein
LTGGILFYSFSSAISELVDRIATERYAAG